MSHWLQWDRVSELVRVLVTGGSGYIGENLQALLVAEGHEVVNYDLDEGNDIRDPDVLIWSTIDAEAVVHLAAISGVPACEEDPYTAQTTNIGGTVNVAHACAVRGIPLVFASSFAALDGSTAYGRQKAWGEQIIRDYPELRASILHFSNVYGGPNYLARKDSVIAKFIKMGRAGDPLTIFGDGEQTRDFIHVDDICFAILHCLVYNKFGSFDICTGSMTTVNAIADIVAEHFGARKVFADGHGTYSSPEGDSAGTRNELGTPEPQTIDDEVRRLCAS